MPTAYDTAVLADNPVSYWLFGADTGAPPAPSEVSFTEGVIYDDNRLLNGWVGAHWGSTVDLAKIQPAISGNSQMQQVVAIYTHSISWRAISGYGGMAFYNAAGRNLVNDTHIGFHALAPTTTQEFTVSVSDAAGVRIGGYKRITGLYAQSRLYGGMPIFFVDLAADLGLTRPFPTIYYVVFQSATPAGWVTDNIIDEVRFYRTRARSIPNHSNVYAENRPRNFVMNHAPLYARGVNPFGPLGPAYLDFQGRFEPYWDKIDGNAAGTTREILEWADRKWGNYIGHADPIKGAGPPPLVVGGVNMIQGTATATNFNELAMAQAAQESQWKNEFQSDPTLRSGLYRAESRGIGQQRGYWYPPNELPILSTAYSAEYKTGFVRAIFNGDTHHATMTPSPVGNIRLCLQSYFRGDTGGGGMYGTYPCAILGGTSTESGAYYAGHINTRPWTNSLWPFDGSNSLQRS